LWRYKHAHGKGHLNKKRKEKSRSFDIPNKIRKVGWACLSTRRWCGSGKPEDISGCRPLEAAGGHRKNGGQQVEFEQVLAFAYMCAL
jgi:hypothetical protein